MWRDELNQLFKEAKTLLEKATDTKEKERNAFPATKKEMMMDARVVADPLRLNSERWLEEPKQLHSSRLHLSNQEVFL